MARVHRPSRTIRTVLTTAANGAAAAAFVAAVGANVFMGELPPVARWDRKTKGVLMYRVPGGTSEASSGIRKPRYVCFCFGGETVDSGEDPELAEEVYDLLCEYLEGSGQEAYNRATAYGHLISCEQVFGLTGWDDYAEVEQRAVVKSYWDFEIGPVTS